MRRCNEEEGRGSGLSASKWRALAFRVLGFVAFKEGFRV